MFQANANRLKVTTRNIPDGAGIFTQSMSDYSDACVLLVQAPGDDGLDMYAEFLHYHGFVPMLVTNAHDALNVAPAAAVIVTGIFLHDSVDGIQLIDRLRCDDRTKNTKPCLLDGLLREVRRLLASSCGKPVSPPALRKSMPDVRHGERTCCG